MCIHDQLLYSDQSFLPSPDAAMLNTEQTMWTVLCWGLQGTLYSLRSTISGIVHSVSITESLFQSFSAGTFRPAHLIHGLDRPVTLHIPHTYPFGEFCSRPARYQYNIVYPSDSQHDTTKPNHRH